MNRLPSLWRGAGTLVVLCLLAVAIAPRSLAQTPAGGNPGTTPIPANVDWDPETQNAVNAINAVRAAQQPALPALQVDAALQNAAAWMDNNQFVTKNCLGQAGQGVITCSSSDTLGRLANQRLSDFGYAGQAIELWGYDRIDGVGDTTTGQGMVNTWMKSPMRTAPMQTILSAPSVALGIARQCQNGVCIWWAYFGSALNQAFAPAAQTAAAQPAPTGPSFTGTWTVDSFVTGPGGTLRLVQNGTQLNGTYSYPDPSGCGAMNGTVQGTVTGNAATFNTNETGCGANNGVGLTGVTITLSADGKSFSTGNGSGAWDGAQPGTALPAPNNPQTTNVTNPQQTTTNPAAAPSFAGTWFVDSWGTGGSGGTITFVVNGNQLTGKYATPYLGGCTINGTVTGTIAGLVATVNSTETACAGPPPAGGGGVQGETLTLDPSGKFFIGSNGVWNGTSANTNS